MFDIGRDYLVQGGRLDEETVAALGGRSCAHPWVGVYHPSNRTVIKNDQSPFFSWSVGVLHDETPAIGMGGCNDRKS